MLTSWKYICIRLHLHSSTFLYIYIFICTRVDWYHFSNSVSAYLALTFPNYRKPKKAYPLNTKKIKPKIIRRGKCYHMRFGCPSHTIGVGTKFWNGFSFLSNEWKMNYRHRWKMFGWNLKKINFRIASVMQDQTIRFDQKLNTYALHTHI